MQSGRGNSSFHGRRTGRPSRPPAPRPDLGLAKPWIENTKERVKSFCAAIRKAAVDLDGESVLEVRVESRRLHECLEGLRPWIHEGRFSRCRRFTRKARRLLSPIREADQVLGVIERLSEENPGHPVASLPDLLHALRETLGKKVKEKLLGLPLNRFERDLGATLENLVTSPPPSQRFMRHLGDVLARRRDRLMEVLNLASQGPTADDLLERLIIDQEKLTYFIEAMSHLKISCYEALSALEVVGHAFDEWRDLGSFLTYLQERLDDPMFMRGKRKAPGQLRELYSEMRSDHDAQLDEAISLIELTGAPNYLRQLLREVIQVPVEPPVRKTERQW